jgi:hypothetical protein
VTCDSVRAGVGLPYTRSAAEHDITLCDGTLVYAIAASDCGAAAEPTWTDEIDNEYAFAFTYCPCGAPPRPSYAVRKRRR